MTNESHDVFLSQVAEQPSRLHDLAAFYDSAQGRELLQEWQELARAHGSVLFAGMGTSEFVPLLVKHTLLQAGLRVSVEDAGELYYYHEAALAQGSLLALVSQSGESIETRRLATEGIARRSSMVALTNDVESTIARHASLVLPMCAGPEAAISTKTYVNTLGLLYLMAQSLHGEAALRQAIAQVRRAADRMAALEVDDAARRAAAFLLPAGALQFVARGPAIVAARQAALTFMEGAKLPATALTAGAFRHGPLELAREGHRAVFFIPQGRTLEITLGLAQECAQKGSRVLIVTDADLPGLDSTRTFVLSLPAVGEPLFPVLAATPQALLLHHVAAERGFVAGIFDHGGKVTTRE
jgi:glucosamine--fructose-6-phosphate aminotransferase (isomerizing)